MPTAEDTKSTWDTIEGLPDDFDFKVLRSYFGFRDNYQDGTAPLLIWEGDSPDTEITQPIIWPIGKKWNIEDEGARVEREGSAGLSKEDYQKKNKFVKSSIYGRLITRVTTELGVDMNKYGPATTGKTWVGLSFHLQREEISFGPGIMEEKGGKTIHLMPTAFLGDSKKGKITAPVKAALIAEKGVKTKTEPESMVSDAVISVKAKTLDRNNFMSWAAEAFEKKQIDEKALNELLDDSDEGYWAKHQV